ncbi:hypothetical protein LMJF_14_0560 [Leishmania major strain Friedlin]|uniref:Uncharacterized protein n=1 Tax=Leishmania major TaxID=5664 RepID=Q4QFS9_LEIMA|nr:hypothetical protein LMJF_14_0560 [Leishmania major strain Friedlin]CAG9571240.1 hypothetical_protein_-_conserved [Leishmania major strain Friedlin]CAJ02910.1 hypothetical protein LMJF_14_0560 [Leishmania major strain Friedlin]|eukprot:XP_001687655.1 hypothetical protein LMJF_14_0560 [Leishmania major strain Friedlin]
MFAVAAPLPAVQALLLTLLLCASAFTSVVVDASPAYLLAQRRGQRFAYEAKSDPVIDVDGLLPNASCSFLYAFTEDMNIFIKNLISSSVMANFGTGAEEHGFDHCNLLSLPQNDWNTTYTLSGCFKTLLHAGIAGDCVADNPLCCVQYWRYPTSLPDRLPSDQIDPRLIFWDGTKAVNGFYTNFSDKYRAHYWNCSSFRPWPECSCTYGANSTLAVDANGEWRYTRRYMPFLTYVEHRVDSPTGKAAAQLTLLDTTSTPAWAAVHQFGDIPLPVPIVVLAGLVVVLFISLLLMYLCGYKPAVKEEKELCAKIEDVQARTAKAEEKLAAKRRRNQRRSSSHSISPESAQLHVLSPKPHQQQHAYAAASLQSQGTQSQLQTRGSFMAVRNRTDAVHQRTSSRADSTCSRKSSPVTSAVSTVNDPPANSILKRAPSTGSMKSAASRQSPQSFQNPLIGRQTFGV